MPVGEALRVPDPDGGAPWGGRTFSVVRGERCAQTGRIVDGKLGRVHRWPARSGAGRRLASAVDLDGMMLYVPVYWD